MAQVSPSLLQMHVPLVRHLQLNRHLHMSWLMETIFCRSSETPMLPCTTECREKGSASVTMHRLGICSTGREMRTKAASERQAHHPAAKERTYYLGHACLAGGAWQSYVPQEARCQTSLQLSLQLQQCLGKLLPWLMVFCIGRHSGMC